MSSSTALVLVNRVLRGSGDYKALTVITGAPADIGDRILDFLNETIADLEVLANWPVLRVNFTGTANGTDDIFDVSTTDVVRSEGAVSVWIDGVGKLEERSPEQFDENLVNTGSGNPLFFQRGVSNTGQLEIQIYPKPVSGKIIHITAYRKATRLVLDTDTTDFDDEILATGTLMRLDAYDGLNRGYASVYKIMRDNLVNDMYRNRSLRVEPESYR